MQDGKRRIFAEKFKPLVMNSLQGKIIWKHLIRDIAKELGSPYSSLDLSRIAFDRLHNQILERFHISTETLGTAQHLHDIIYRGETYNFSKASRIKHKRFACILDMLRNPDDSSDAQKKTELEGLVFNGYWENYALYLYSIGFQNVEYLNKDFWEMCADVNAEAALKQYIENQNKLSIPYLIKHGILTNDKVLHKTLSDDGVNFLNIIFNNRSSCLTYLTSNIPGEGKTTFLWQLAFYIHEKVDCIWIKDISKAQVEIHNIEIKSSDKVVIIIDDQLATADSHAFININRVLRQKFFGLQIILILSDHPFYIKQFREELKSIQLQYPQLYYADNFKLDKKENIGILNLISNEYLKVDKLTQTNSLEFLTSLYAKGLSLRIIELLKSQNICRLEGDIWQSDQKIKNEGLQDLYSLVALLSLYNIKFPIDYYSKRFFNGSKKDAIINLLINNSAHSEILAISEKQDEYPHRYVYLKNSTLGCSYAMYDVGALIKSEDFLFELTSIISAGNAEDSHSYIFRKFFAQRWANTYNAKLPLSKELNSLDTITLLNSLISNSPLCSSLSREKCKTVKSSEYRYKEMYKEAIETLDDVADKETNVVVYLKSKTYFEANKIRECINLALNYPKEDQFTYLLGKCYLREEFINEGISHFMSNIEAGKIENYNLAHLLRCLSQLANFGQAEIAIDHYKKLATCIELKYQRDELHSQVLHSMASVLFAQVKKLDQKQKAYYLEFGIASENERFVLTESIKEKIAQAEDLLKKAKLLTPTFLGIDVTKAAILLNQGDHIGSLELALKVVKEHPYSSGANVQIAEIYLYRHENEESSTDDLTKALSYLDINFSQFTKRQERQVENMIATYMTQTKILKAIGGVPELKFAKKQLRYFMFINKINNVNDPNTKVILKQMNVLSSLIRAKEALIG